MRFHQPKADEPRMIVPTAQFLAMCDRIQELEQQVRRLEQAIHCHRLVADHTEARSFVYSLTPEQRAAAVSYNGDDY